MEKILETKKTLKKKFTEHKEYCHYYKKEKNHLEEIKEVAPITRT